MYGAILGDMIGAPYEFDRGAKIKTFPLFIDESRFTDDTVMTVAVAEALMDTLGKDDDAIRAALTASMRKWGRRYPRAGYGARFIGWLKSDHPQPYGSYGNGSAMRASAAGWLGHSVEEARHLARLSAGVTHNHPEGIKGAEATASAIFLSRMQFSKPEIRDYVAREFGYDLSRSCDEIRPGYHHVESCQQTVPEALTAFLEGTDFEDVIRTAVSLGGDCDTLTCIAGSVAEAFYGVPEAMIRVCRDRLPEDLLQVVDRFRKLTAPAQAAARATDWKTQPMPDLHRQFAFRRHLSAEQMDHLRRGHIPREMEDKWFWYMEGDALYAHRSWTGYCVFILRFDPDGDSVRATVNDDPRQYACGDDAHEEARINRLLDWWSRPAYDHCGEWLSETAEMLKRPR